MADALGLVSADDVFLVDRDGDRQLSDEEFHMAYRWLTWDASLRVEGVLEAPAARWFYLADLDGDGYLSGLERREWSRRLSELDTDQDGSLVPADLPMVVRAAVRRSPRRVAIPSANSSPREVEAPLPNWFTAMDMNGDGVVEPAEFLGESEDFRSYDRNQNRRIEPTEVYDALPNQ
ncbi:MAG: hypothetical protein KatS3mg111_4247 [Pirellulaceae bacterium]|nr:MAG: hypothetical protein KatS3mg111_4247 [Pirellulaceae bacterium]